MAFLIIKDYRLVTAEIVYRLPDYPALLQTYIWQEHDLLPDYPELSRFLKFWRSNLEGALHSIRVANARSIRQEPFVKADFLLHLN